MEYDADHFNTLDLQEFCRALRAYFHPNLHPGLFPKE